MKFSFKQKDNTAAIEGGVWVSLDDEKFNNRLVIDDPGTGPAWKVASMKSRLYETAYDRVTRKHQDVIRAQTWVPRDVRAAVEMEGLVAASTDWRLEDDGQPVPFSKDAARDFLKDHRQVYERLELVAGNLARYSQQEETADAENLSSTSATHLNGKATDDMASPPAMSTH